MSFYQSSVSKSIVLVRKEGRYLSMRQAEKCAYALSDCLGLTLSQTQLGYNYLMGDCTQDDFFNEWTGTPAEQNSFIELLHWYSCVCTLESLPPKGAFV